MLTFRTHLFLALIGFMIFTLGFVSVGIRWHTYSARAAYYARQEVYHTFEAAGYARAARDRGNSAEAEAHAIACQKLAAIHQKAADENTRLRKFFENCW